MEWTYKITAASRPRLLMRIAQVFDQQLLSMRELKLADVAGVVTVQINVEVSADLAQRIQAKLYSHTDIRKVELSYSGGVNLPSTAVQPPSTIVSVPVTNDPASEAR
jgi:glycine cleavage system regulatory protein